MENTIYHYFTEKDNHKLKRYLRCQQSLSFNIVICVLGSCHEYISYNKEFNLRDNTCYIITRKNRLTALISWLSRQHFSTYYRCRRFILSFVSLTGQKEEYALPICQPFYPDYYSCWMTPEIEIPKK